MNKLRFSRLGLMLVILVALVLTGVSTAQAQAATDLYIGFNDAAGPIAAQNDYVIDIGSYASLTNCASTNGGTIDLMSVNAPIQIVQSTFSSNFVYAFSSDSSALNDVAAGVAGGTATPKTLWQTAPVGVTPGTISVSSFGQAYQQPQSLVAGEYASTTQNSGWTWLIAASPTVVGTETAGNSVASSTGTNPMGYLVNGDLILSLWQNTEGGNALHPVVEGWTNFGYFTFNANTSDITFTLGAAPAPPTIPGIASVFLSDGNFFIIGTNGQANAQFRVLSTTNMSLPEASWTPVLTNTFSATGAYTFSNSVSGTPAAFFRIVSP